MTDSIDDQKIKGFLAKLATKPSIRYQYFDPDNNDTFGLSPDELKEVHNLINNEVNSTPLSNHVVVAMVKYERLGEEDTIITISTPQKTESFTDSQVKIHFTSNTDKTFSGTINGNIDNDDSDVTVNLLHNLQISKGNQITES